VPLGGAEQIQRPCRQCAALTMLHDYLTTSDRSNARFLSLMALRSQQSSAKAARARCPLSQLILNSLEHHRQSRFIDDGRRHVLAAAPGLANRRVACKPGRFSDALKCS
jgi:hypothetical protein